MSNHVKMTTGKKRFLRNLKLEREHYKRELEVAVKRHEDTLQARRLMFDVLCNDLKYRKKQIEYLTRKIEQLSAKLQPHEQHANDEFSQETEQQDA